MVEAIYINYNNNSNIWQLLMLDSMLKNEYLKHMSYLIFCWGLINLQQRLNVALYKHYHQWLDQLNIYLQITQNSFCNLLVDWCEWSLITLLHCHNNSVNILLGNYLALAVQTAQITVRVLNIYYISLSVVLLSVPFSWESENYYYGSAWTSRVNYCFWSGVTVTKSMS